MRWEIVKKFNNSISPFSAKIKNVAVVGGTSREPELEFLNNASSASISILGIEPDPDCSNFTFLDLNLPMSITTKKFDLVICSQVLEHLWDVKQGIQNLVSLTEPGGLIWIGCPASNYAHGSPDYYSAGYQPELIKRHLEDQDVKILELGVLGSKRYYYMTHVLQIWGSRREHSFPLASGFSRFFPLQILGRFISTLKSPKMVANAKFATETYVFGQRQK